MTASRPRAIFFDAGNTLIFPRVEQLAEELTAQGYPATVEDFYAAERAGKQKLASWLLPQIENGQIPRLVDLTYWLEYLRALAERIGVPEGARDQVMRRVGESYATDIAGARAAGLRGVLFDDVGVYDHSGDQLDCPRITALPQLAGVLETLSRWTDSRR